MEYREDPIAFQRKADEMTTTHASLTMDQQEARLTGVGKKSTGAAHIAGGPRKCAHRKGAAAGGSESPSDAVCSLTLKPLVDGIVTQYGYVYERTVRSACSYFLGQTLF